MAIPNEEQSLLYLIQGKYWAHNKTNRFAAQQNFSLFLVNYFQNNIAVHNIFSNSKLLPEILRTKFSNLQMDLDRNF